MSVVTAFIERNIVADDPAPEYSRLDRFDFPVSGECFHGRHNPCSDHEAAAVALRGVGTSVVSRLTFPWTAVPHE